MALNKIFGTELKDRKKSYQVRKILAPFCKVVVLTLG